MATKGEERFRRDIENSSHLEYVRKMKTFYEGLFEKEIVNNCRRLIGEVAGVTS